MLILSAVVTAITKNVGSRGLQFLNDLHLFIEEAHLSLTLSLQDSCFLNIAPTVTSENSLDYNALRFYALKHPHVPQHAPV
jgi:hypothetical protein